MDKPFTNGKGRGYNAQNLLKKNGIDFEHFAFTPKEEILIEYGQAIAEDPKHMLSTSAKILRVILLE